MTANWSKGGKTLYPYHICRNHGSQKFATSVNRAKVEEAFEGVLRQLVPTPALASAVYKLFRNRWAEGEARTAEMRIATKRGAAAIEKNISIMLHRIMESGSKKVIARYEAEVEKLEIQKFATLEKRKNCGTSEKLFEYIYELIRSFVKYLKYLGKWKFYDKHIILLLKLE